MEFHWTWARLQPRSPKKNKNEKPPIRLSQAALSLGGLELAEVRSSALQHGVPTGEAAAPGGTQGPENERKAPPLEYQNGG